jgi:hypothetical protein
LSDRARGAFTLSEYGITPPSKVGITVVEDRVDVSLDFSAIP